MKKVVVMSYPDRPRVHGDNEFEVHRFDIRPYIETEKTYYIFDIDVLYRSGAPRYHRMLERFVREHGDADIVIVNGLNAFHPEWLHDAMPRAIKIWGCVDDPVASYQRTAACVWAYDGAFYVSPSYARGRSMAEALQLWGSPHTHWFPLAGNFWNPIGAPMRATAAHRDRVLASLARRPDGLVYVGNLYGPKFDRLAELKRRLGSRLSVYGRWPLKGYAGFLGPLRGRRFMPHRVRRISAEERDRVYLSHRIGLNMHFSDLRETGNMRMYEAPCFGLMQLCDKAADDRHLQIFAAGEAVYYDSVEEAVALGEYYLANDDARIRIARAGFERFCRDYDNERCFLDLLRWAQMVPLRSR
jgi:hypothetical protein